MKDVVQYAFDRLLRLRIDSGNRGVKTLTAKYFQTMLSVYIVRRFKT